MNLLGQEAENVQQYSVDEAFFVLPHEDVETSHRVMAEVVRKVKQYVGIPVSVGFAPSRTLAKIANHIANRRPIPHTSSMGVRRRIMPMASGLTSQ